MQGIESLDNLKNLYHLWWFGRYEDTYIVHAVDETVVPMEVLDRTCIEKRLFKTMMDMGIEPEDTL